MHLTPISWQANDWVAKAYLNSLTNVERADSLADCVEQESAPFVHLALSWLGGCH
ncbi:hypothetical protein [Tengunoibacter tsumagoiensis]|uniref:Uncharacterized protein n=1 Tax=Tengunoibacter tsumagoiensis TaxID=2014871 RepID=A0A402A4J5_9CHLR|nr:hypothetical protein [Tengunoibacter tsumagoiensis]GCE13921.1 hypothetical protein KTT_37800 [Tengunoibacter tsumagoiensis]